jgi:hypothetical protein
MDVVATEQREIVALDQIVANLPSEERELFDRFFHLSSTVGELNPPQTMYRWIEKYFGSVDAVRRQKVVKLTNRWTLESSLFNELRAHRPLEARIPSALAEEIARSHPDPFDDPEANTPEDVFGRIHTRHAVTASNIAKYDGFHGVVVFDEHDPLAFTEETVVGALDAAVEWYNKAHATDPDAIYPFFMWNCLWKSGASIPHGHAQMSLTKGMHYGKVELLRRAALQYNTTFDANYFADYYRAHEMLGLGVMHGNVRMMAHLVPLKEKEIILFGDRLDDDLKRSLYCALACLTGDLGVTSFNLTIALPPLAETGENWSDFPVVVRMVDRGDPMNRTADFGAMELYASSVVSSDPFRVAAQIKECVQIGERTGRFD